MKNLIGFVTFVVFAALTLVGCGHASFDAGAQAPNSTGGKTGYTVKGMSYNPEAMVSTLSNASVQETNAQTYREAVQRGLVYPYMGGPSRFFQNQFCPGGFCVQPPGAPVTGATSTPAQAGTKADDKRPVTQEQLGEVKITAERADRRACKVGQVQENLRAREAGETPRDLCKEQKK